MAVAVAVLPGSTCVLADGSAVLSPADLLVVLDALADGVVLRGRQGRECCLTCIGQPVTCDSHREDLDAAAAYEAVAARLGDVVFAAAPVAPRPAGTVPGDVAQRLQLLQERYMRLLAVSRAAVAARRDGDADPAGYVAAELEERGQVPPPGMHPAELLAAVRQAAVLAGVVA